MVIDGRKMGKRITHRLKKKIELLKQNGIIPGLAIVTLGDETTWKAYVGQKLKLAERLGIYAKLYSLENADQETFLALIHAMNQDKSIHGIIAQRPFPKDIDPLAVIDAIDPQKDIDGFAKNSPYPIPSWLAVEHILKGIHRQLKTNQTFSAWLKSKTLAVIGKGATAGLPISIALKRKRIYPIVIDSKTLDTSKILKNADIIISAVGKRIIHPGDLKSGVVLVGIGLGRGEDGKLHGDYDENEIENIASFHTPTPGGVGPVNLAYLFKNLLDATKKQTH